MNCNPRNTSFYK